MYHCIGDRERMTKRKGMDPYKKSLIDVTKDLKGCLSKVSKITEMNHRVDHKDQIMLLGDPEIAEVQRIRSQLSYVIHEFQEHIKFINYREKYERKKDNGKVT